MSINSILSQNHTPPYSSDEPYSGCFSIRNTAPGSITPLDDDIAFSNYDPSNYRLVIYTTVLKVWSYPYHATYCLFDRRTRKILFPLYVHNQYNVVFKTYDPRRKNWHKISLPISEYGDKMSTDIWFPLDVEAYIGDKVVASLTYSANKDNLNGSGSIRIALSDDEYRGILIRSSGHVEYSKESYDDVDKEPEYPVVCNYGGIFCVTNNAEIHFKLSLDKTVKVGFVLVDGVVVSKVITNRYVNEQIHKRSRHEEHNITEHIVAPKLLPLTSVFYLDGERIGESYIFDTNDK